MSKALIEELELLVEQYLKEVEAVKTTLRILKTKQLKEEQTNIEEQSVVKPLPKSEENTPSLTQSAVQTNKEIVLAAIDELGRFVKKSEIAKKVNHVGIKDEPLRFALAYLRKRGIIATYKATSNNADSFWGRSEWLENGKIKNGYVHSKSTPLIGKK